MLNNVSIWHNAVKWYKKADYGVGYPKLQIPEQSLTPTIDGTMLFGGIRVQSMVLVPQN
jgi:hypothetical protein